MAARIKRRIAILVLAVLAFAQLNVALANCAMNGSMMMQATAGTPDKPCEDCDTPLGSPRDQIPSLCATHCATDAQPAAVPAAMALSQTEVLILVLPRRIFEARPTGLDGPPSGAPPRRILLHSFLI